MFYTEMSKEQLLAEKNELEKQYSAFKAEGLKLNMARGNPCPEQLDLSMPMLSMVSDEAKTAAGADARAYGMVDGIPEAKELFASLLDVKPEEIIVGGNSSLQLMYDSIMRALQLGVVGGDKPWCKYDKVKFICPTPGYDRHFAICQALGIEMIAVDYLSDGPDMDKIEKLVSSDDSIKGMWCVPKYSNPTGITYSAAAVKRIAAMKPAAKDFRIFWDNAYCVHHLYENDRDELLNIIEECKKAGNPDMVYEFASTSKVSFAGGGVACIAASEANIEFIKKHMGIQTIGFDKINQLRHVKFFKDIDGINKQMLLHADIIRPKFEAVLKALEEEIAPIGMCSWSKPKGGYFISFNAPDGTAKHIVGLCKEAGVVMTGAGATYPYGNDPHDSNIRIAPTFPSVEELEKAAEGFCVCVKLASVEKLLGE